MRKLKPNAVVTLGCGGLLFFGTLGILSEVVSRRGPVFPPQAWEDGAPPADATKNKRFLTNITVKPGEWSHWIARQEGCRWMYMEWPGDNRKCDYQALFEDGTAATRHGGEFVLRKTQSLRVRNVTKENLDVQFYCY